MVLKRATKLEDNHCSFFILQKWWNFLERIRVTYYDITLSQKLYNLREKL